ncbi:High cysteine protein [Giardia muris]|uniref:High cysteine protein n=1 Tax=Giardia muris TaxID=5742 RepID=A0A4Z1T238_GIAMU|nr:High cysteine protein [Giardia muris]|eukprot:TNJ26639.1 High cysteine protein [Giardia muris]
MIDRSSGRAVPEIDVLEGSMEVKARDAGACADGSTFTIPGVEGTFCKKCSETGEAPINGKCGTPVADTDHCTSDSKGACTDCKATSSGGDLTSSTYFLFNGGCYDQTKEPGSKLCGATPTDGVCGTAASGTFIKDNNLYLCSDATNGGKENCGTCTYALNAFTCSECIEGHHSSSSSPISCTKCALLNCVSYPDSKDVCTTCLNGFQELWMRSGWLVGARRPQRAPRGELWASRPRGRSLVVVGCPECQMGASVEGL